MSKRLHSNRQYLHLFLFIGSITALHLVSHLVSQSTPQIVQSIIDPSNSPPLDELYNGGWSITYLFRNLSLMYSIYPTIFLIFLMDYYEKGCWLKWLNWKIILIFLVSIVTVVSLAGNPHLYIPSGMIYYTKVVFGSGGAFTLFGITTWILLLVLSFKILQNKMQKHHALWLTLLIFLSCQEVWEYAPYIWGAIVYPEPITLPTNLLISLHTWRAMPSMLLIYYAFKLGFSSLKESFFLSFFISVAASLFLIVRTDLYLFAPFLRVIWAITYVLFAFSLNCKAEVKE